LFISLGRVPRLQLARSQDEHAERGEPTVIAVAHRGFSAPGDRSNQPFFGGGVVGARKKMLRSGIGLNNLATKELKRLR